MGILNQEKVSTSNEDLVRSLLLEKYKNSYGEDLNRQVELLLSLDGYIDRFNYLQSVLGQQMESLFSNIMISGYSAGSEMIVARNFGFQEICGVEVDESLCEITKKRVSVFTKMTPEIYDGLILPYENQQFNLVVSGHIIEHTESPRIYLSEVMRVLKPNGYLFLEFPTRYHHTELHTGLLSFEWLPVFLRNIFLRFLISDYSILSSKIKNKYKNILTSKLKQISRFDIFLLLKKLRINYKEISFSKPAPGIVRCILQKL